MWTFGDIEYTEEKEKIKEEDKKAGKPKIVIVMIIAMVAIMAAMFAVSYFWSMEKLSSAIAFPVMAVCLVVEIVLCEISNKINHKLED